MSKATILIIYNIVFECEREDVGIIGFRLIDKKSDQVIPHTTSMSESGGSNTKKRSVSAFTYMNIEDFEIEW